ncbi:MAG TPA: LysR substrate-binding domain-containing protein [Burkholderiaceae bacterium]|nr:LysR substrate-binding domain-containing protein [Burkholderiaceae bacterium]
MNTSLPRTRPLSVGALRTFEAVARLLNFRAAADELALTQSAVSRQIQALETELGTPLFIRHTRSVALTSAGAVLVRATLPALNQLDHAVRQIRQTLGRRSVSITTWASFASMWLIPRLEAFQQAHPDIDIRIDATDARVDMQAADVDLALRYATHDHLPPNATRLFGEQLTPVASPWLLASQPVSSVADLAQCTWIEAGDAYRSHHLQWLTWQRWVLTHANTPSSTAAAATPASRMAASSRPPSAARLAPQRWLYFNYAHQILQAALTGQGVALARMPLVADSLANGSLVEVLPQHRLDSPLAYWLVRGPHGAQRPEVDAFCQWLQAEAALTRQATGEAPPAPTQAVR